MTGELPDAIDLLVGITPGSSLAATRARHPVARDNAQASYVALFQPDDTADMSLLERYAVASFVAALHRQPQIAAHYEAGLRGQPGGADLADALGGDLAAGAAEGPYGHYPAGPLSGEDVPGPVYNAAASAGMQPRLAAALAHTHFLVFHPRDATPEALQLLLDAGWSTTGIVTLSQLVAFLAFQIRVVAGLRALAATLPEGAPA